MQIGLFLRFPPLVGTTALGFGIFLLLLWDYREHFLTVLPFAVGESWLPRTVVTLPLGFGVSLAATATLVRYESFWVYSAVLFLAARCMQGALLLYGLRKLVYYAQAVLDWARRTIAVAANKSNGNQPEPAGRDRLKQKVIGKLRRRVVKRFAVFFGVILTTVALMAFHNGDSQGQFLWAVFVMLTTAVTLLVRIRDVASSFGRVPMFGLLFCIAGAEVYSFPDLSASLLPATLQPLSVLLPLLDLFPALSFVSVGLVVAGQLALLAGVLLSVLLLSVQSTSNFMSSE